MALNIPVFRTRALSALVFVGIMLAGLLYNHWSFLVLFVIIHTGCWYEYLRLVEKPAGIVFPRLSGWGFMLMGLALMLAFCGKAFTINGYAIRQNLCLPLAIAGFVVLVTGILNPKNKVDLKAYGQAALGWLYISLSWGLMMSLRQEGMAFKGQLLALDFGRVFPLLLILAIWANDTCAYLVGSFIGKTPFSKISPKKTWEGTIGGILLAVILMATLGSYLVTGKMSVFNGLVGLVAAVFGTLGDLYESKLKRTAGVKDSGQMLPGHGGFLDRFDSLLIATPPVWLLVQLL